MSLERIGRKKADNGTYRDIFSAKEIRSLLYYQNAGKNIVLSDNEKHLEKFYAIENAYEVINMLMFDDIGSEQVRLSAEGRWMDPDILNNMNELLDVYCNLYSAICKYTYLIKKRAVYTYRDDRRYTYLHMKTHKFNESFLSATLNEKKQMNLFQEKEDLTFFEFKVDQSIEYLDINEVLGEMSKYPDEREILFPPFMNLELKRMELTPDEKTMRGIRNKSPYGKYLVVFKDSKISPTVLTEKIRDELTELRKMILDPSSIEDAKAVWEQVRGNNYNVKNIDNIKYYLEWKKNLQLYIRKCYSVIKWEIMSFKGRECMFRNELKDQISNANKKREMYENRVQWIFGTEIFFGVLAGIFLAFNAIEYHPERFKIMAICALGIVAFQEGISKVFSLTDKLHQRTSIFLQYDELRMKWEFEQVKDPERLNEYIQRMLDISILDNELCKQYTENRINNMHKWEKNMEEKSEWKK